jgi:hypothetical protein
MIEEAASYVACPIRLVVFVRDEYVSKPLP